MARYYIQIILLSVILLFTSCTAGSDAGSDFSVPSDVSSGDIVLRRESGLISSMFASVASQNRIFSHIGILCLKDSNPFVLHCEAIEASEVSSLRLESFSDFVSESDTFSIYHINASASVSNDVARSAYSLYQDGARFDFAFDNATDSLLYCTEYAAKAINQVMGDSAVKPTLEVRGRKVFSIDDVLSVTH